MNKEFAVKVRGDLEKKIMRNPIYKGSSVVAMQKFDLKEALNPHFKNTPIYFNFQDLFDEVIKFYSDATNHYDALEFAIKTGHRQNVYKLAKKSIDYYKVNGLDATALETAKIAVKYFEREQAYHRAVSIAAMVDITWAEKIGNKGIRIHEKNNLKSHADAIRSLLREIKYPIANNDDLV
ncbi:MAG: hypothetical protein KGH71_04310 [Candidatus Micrarchaeota archaeon]|nr:hypothetical protein [Candidatus Micrarchaeota archaeon]